MAQERSFLSFIFEEKAVFWRTVPISSAMETSLFLKMVSLSGSMVSDRNYKSILGNSDKAIRKNEKKR